MTKRGIPAQVQAQSDRADELLKQGSDQGTPPSENPDDQPPAGTAPAETVESLKQQLVAAQNEAAMWKGKYEKEILPVKGDADEYKRLKGEFRILSNQYRTMNGQLTEANNLIVELRKQITEKKDAGAEPVTDPMVLLSDEDKAYLRDEGFTADRLIGIVGKIVHGMAPKAAPAAKEEAQPKTDPAQSAGPSPEEVFWAELNREVPDWKKINGNVKIGIPSMPEFDAWLDRVIPYSGGKTHADAMQEAQKNLDYATVIQLFNDFKATLPPDPEKKQKEEGKPSLNPEEHIEPKSSVGAPDRTDAGPQGKIFTRKEINAFYAKAAVELANPRTSKERREEIARTDAEILKAEKEGRVQG